MTKTLSITSAFLFAVILFFSTASLQAAAPLLEKTLVVWACPDTFDQKGGSALTIDDLKGGFDAIVFAELAKNTWMPGSDRFQRSPKDRTVFPAEENVSDRFVQLALVHRKNKVSMFRDGKQVAEFDVKELISFPETVAVLFGMRHLRQGGKETFIGRIDDARIYDKALAREEIASLRPNQPSAIEPYAWWHFEGSDVGEQTGRFPSMFLAGDAAIRDGKLVLGGNGGTLIAMPKGTLPDRLLDLLVRFDSPNMSHSKVPPQWVDAQRQLRRMQLNDKYRPTWHLAIPEGSASPFDPNGAIFKDGVYHMWYLYQAEAGHHWAHVSSLDLFHWRWHSNDLQPHPGDVDKGIFSGNAFLAPDGKVVIAYHGVGTGGNCIAYSSDPELNTWTKAKANPTAAPGWDPHMWYENGKYYQLSSGSKTSLYVSDAYDKKMERVGDFMKHDMPGVDEFEDISCPDFFQMGDKWVLVCISHPRGARYYIGQWDGKQFTPESHHRMNWPGGTYFAPETLLDDRGRRILWTWILDKRRGTTSGVMAMPRVLTLDETKLALNIEPPEEIERLRYQPKSVPRFDVPAGKTARIPEITGDCAEFEIMIDPGKTKRFGINVFCSDDGREKTPIRFNLDENIVQTDMRHSSLTETVYRELLALFGRNRNLPNPAMETQDAPFTLKENEKVTLRIFLDKTILEVFVNGRQCITQIVYPTLDDAIHVEAFAEDGPVTVESVRSWKLFPAMQW